ncbi:hypothetical protein K466DRAFT_569239 [Polyporus arcularius HHB13444]|uniref:Uncharacterized protein n=1 Tax=Polyporus arcularius HHB13444 TaxID=1314778 RepID=A0A5C3P5N5_9APHY|nr:hypothetical protein K466DRAFT_569239 [Polyporus arcularius HHB13444]
MPTPAAPRDSRLLPTPTSIRRDLLERSPTEVETGLQCEEGRRSEPVLVYARWAGSVGGRTHPTGILGTKKHVYSTSIPPEVPLRIGMHVRILATTPAWYSTQDADPESYDTYDAHVVGPITGVAGWKDRKVVLEVRNECQINTVETVKIRIPFAPEVTVHLDASLVPAGQREAQEVDLNTDAVVRARSGDARCGGMECWTPWRRLVGEGFLWEPMVDDVSERPGIKPGRKIRPAHFLGWKEAVEAESEGRAP